MLTLIIILIIRLFIPRKFVKAHYVDVCQIRSTFLTFAVLVV